MSSSSARYLLDLNALIALVDVDHVHYRSIQRWFDATGNEDWGLCPLTEAGFVRVTTNPAYCGVTRTIAQATAMLAELASHPGCRYWPMTESWSSLTAPFVSRIFGHQQITDAYLLGLAIKNDAALATLDKAVPFMAGQKYQQHVCLLEQPSS